jgi:predicted AAA+ superfamily ATPase
MKTLPRLVSAALSERMRVMPAVVVTGARQTGKSTLAEQLVPGARRYATLDDLDVLDAARRDPEVLVGGSTPVTLDEVQREPELLRAVKRAIDRDRKPGRFLLTGSANLLLMRQVSESLAGRASYWGDTGVAMQLAETEEPGGAHMENLVLHDLLAWRDARIEHAELGYWRTSIGEDARERTTKLEAITAWAVFRAKAELSSSSLSPGEVIQRTWEARGLIVGRQLTEGSNAMTGCA